MSIHPSRVLLGQEIQFIVRSYLNFYKVVSSDYFFTQCPIKYEWFLNRSFLPIDGNQTGTIAPNQSEPRSNDKKGFF